MYKIHMYMYMFMYPHIFIVFGTVICEWILKESDCMCVHICTTVSAINLHVKNL